MVTYSTSAWVGSPCLLLGQQEDHRTRSTHSAGRSLRPSSTIVSHCSRTGRKHSTEPSLPTHGSTDHNHSWRTSRRTWLQNGGYNTDLCTNTHTVHPLRCVWPNARTSWLLSCSHPSTTCFSTQSQCSSNHSSQEDGPCLHGELSLTIFKQPFHLPTVLGFLSSRVCS